MGLLMFLFYGCCVGVPTGFALMVITRVMWKRITRKITGSHDVVITAFETLKTIRKNKEPITIKVQMTEWTADAIATVQLIGLRYNDFLNYCWFDYHEKKDREKLLGIPLIDPEEAYWFGEKPNSGEALVDIMKEHNVFTI